MKEKTLPVYFCKFCNKYYIRKNHCATHERFCRKNPNNKHACFEWCDNLEKLKVDIGGYSTHFITDFKCKVTGNHMYSYIAEKGYFQRDGIRMPLECKHYAIRM